MAWVTEAGGEKFEEKLCIRPTSETIITTMYYKWTQAYKNNNSNIVKNNEILYNSNERESDIYDTTRSNTKYDNPRMETEDEKVNTRSEYEIRRIEEEKYYESNRKELTAAKSRCMPFKQEHIGDKCVCCGKTADKMVVWGRQY